MAETHVVLPGSQRPLKRDAVRIGDVDPNARVEVTVTVRGPELPQPGAALTRAQFDSAYGASRDDIDTVSKVLERFGLTVEDASEATRSVRVSGTADEMEAAFHPRLGIYRTAAQGDFRGRQGKVQIPSELAGLVTGVFGLDQRRVAHRKGASAVKDTPAVAPAPLTPADLETHYRFPPGQGAGHTVAIAEFGGAYFPNDLAAFATKAGRPAPTVTQAGVGMTPLTLDDLRQMPKVQRSQAMNESVEVNMDVQIVAGLCPAADIVVYFAQFDQKGWVDLLNEVIAGKPASAATLSVSWGLAEDSPDWSGAALQAINERLQAASLLGITVCVAAGDDGSGDQVGDQQAHVDFPASSPFVLAVGGTMLQDAADVVWWESPGQRTQNGGGATGGGVSVEFPRPPWQDVKIASVNPGTFDGRVVPDVAALAGSPFYDLMFMGQPMPNGGTSASAPLWASLITRVYGAQSPARPPVFLSPLLYQKGPTGAVRGVAAFVDVTEGHNVSPQPGHGYDAGPGFDAVSGWGVPNGQALLESL
jgi:kumamolisin